MPDWLHVLVDPYRHLNMGVHGHLEGVCRLAAGDIDGYIRLSDRGDVPPLQAPEDEDEEPFLSILRLRLTGEHRALQVASSLAESSAETSARSAARILASVLLAESWNYEAAIALLKEGQRDALDQAPGFGLSYFLLHESLQLAEAGEIPSAVEAAQAASKHANRNTRVGAALYTVGQWNAREFQFAQGIIPEDTQVPSRAASRLLMEAGNRALSAAPAYIQEVFEAATEAPGSRSLRVRKVDPVDIGLSAGLIRSELLADVTELRRWRGARGRYLFLGSTQSTPSMQLLLQAGEAKALRRVARTTVREGPLWPVADLLAELSAVRWPIRAVRSVLSLLAEGGQMLERDAADNMVGRLLSEFPSLQSPRLGQDNTAEILEALSKACTSASEHEQAVVAEWLLSQIEEGASPLLLQRARTVVSNIDWGAVPEELASRWIGFSLRHVGERSDVGICAEAVLLALDDSSVRQQLHEAIDSVEDVPQTPALDFLVARMAVDRAAHPGPATLERLEQSARSAMESTLASAREGSFQMAAGIDSAAMAAWLLAYFGDEGREDLRETLAALLTSAEVAADDKVRALDLMADEVQRLPTELKRAVLEGSGALAGHGVMWKQDYAGEGAALRFRLACKSLAEADAIAHVGMLAHRTEAEARVQAAASIPYLLEGGYQAEWVAAVGLGLTYDASAEVRASAGRAFMSSAWPGEWERLPALADRTAVLMRESGETVPLRVAQGAAESMEGGGNALVGLLGSLFEIQARDHPSAFVRWFASHVVNRA